MAKVERRMVKIERRPVKVERAPADEEKQKSSENPRKVFAQKSPVSCSSIKSIVCCKLSFASCSV